MSAREYYHHVMWYTVWDAKTGELVAAGTSAMCAAKLGYKNAVSFSAAVCHWFKDGQETSQVHLPAGVHPPQRGGQSDSTGTP